MKFIDLFAGLGGFHIALSKLGHECIFASEVKESLIKLYERNFGIKPSGDIREINAKDIPKHDILCAGFPCQPFSKAGLQMGLNDESNGDLFHEIVRILKYHKPSFFILENVQHLAKHDNEVTYSQMSEILTEIGYSVAGRVLSPHEYNIPQHRQRLFIVGSRFGLSKFKWPIKIPLSKTVFDFIEPNPKTYTNLELKKSECLDVWQEFLDRIPKKDKLPSFPIWAMEFGATYPFEHKTPFASNNLSLGKYRGSFGAPLSGLSREDKFLSLPSYARANQKTFPDWKKNYIRSNRAFYERYHKSLSSVVRKIKMLGVSSWQKFEWNIQGGDRNVRNYIIQFRGSGIRLKKPDFFPSLVCVSTQIPIIGWKERYITKHEGLRLQGMEELEFLPENINTCFDALGNAVNTTIVELVASELLNQFTVEKICNSKLGIGDEVLKNIIVPDVKEFA